MEIVPDGGALVVESQIGLGDANDLNPGQKAEVRLVGLRGHIAPLNGIVSRVSADSFIDDKNGRSFYTATVNIPRGELERVSRLAGITGTVRPGTPVDVGVPLRRRSALEYWIGPLTTRLSPALSER